MSGTPLPEIPIDHELVAELIAQQHPDLSSLNVHTHSEGWDNAVFRLGAELVVRLPRRAAAAQLILNEQRWLPDLADRLNLPTPVPYRTGIPALGYPWHWSILPWIKGEPADRAAVHESQAEVLAHFLRALHTAAPDHAPENALRGCALQQRASAVEERIHRLAGHSTLITEQICTLWQTALQAELDVEVTWLHGDLHPGNILVEAGVITGIIDWGDITSGDCATDLASIWMLFDEPQLRDRAFQAYGRLSLATFQRTQGWAILFAVMLLDSGLVDNPGNAAIGAKILCNLMDFDKQNK